MDILFLAVMKAGFQLTWINVQICMINFGKVTPDACLFWWFLFNV